MLNPISLKYKKYHKVYIPKLKEKKNLLPSKGVYGLKALESGKLNAIQISSLIKLLKFHIKKTDKFWFNIILDKAVSKKSIGSRMGKGKGAHSHWVTVFKKGKILIEFGGFGLPYAKFKLLLKLCQNKLPIRISLIRRRL